MVTDNKQPKDEDFLEYIPNDLEKEFKNLIAPQPSNLREENKYSFHRQDTPTLPLLPDLDFGELCELEDKESYEELNIEKSEQVEGTAKQIKKNFEDREREVRHKLDIMKEQIDAINQLKD